jgi:hypothetical protein
MKMANFSHSSSVSACFLCQGFYCTSMKKRLLQAGPDSLTKVFPGANPRRGQERKETTGARLGSRATGSFCLMDGGETKEAQSGAGGRSEFIG